MTLTDQQIYDTVAVHLLTQGRPAMLDTACVFRTTAGLTCSVGALIPDDRYDPIIDHEQWPISKLIDKGFINCEPDQISLLGRLQRAHDSICYRQSSDPTKFDIVLLKRRLAHIANEFGLTPHPMVLE